MLPDGWYQTDLQRRGGSNKPTNPRHLLNEGVAVCSRWKRFRARTEQQADAPKCLSCLRVLASQIRRGQFVDPDVG